MLNTMNPFTLLPEKQSECWQNSGSTVTLIPIQDFLDESNYETCIPVASNISCL